MQKKMPFDEALGRATSLIWRKVVNEESFAAAKASNWHLEPITDEKIETNCIDRMKMAIEVNNKGGGGGVRSHQILSTLHEEKDKYHNDVSPKGERQPWKLICQ